MKVTPTTLKKLEQANVGLDRDFYTGKELANLFDEDVIFAISRDGKIYKSETCDRDSYWIVTDRDNYLAISLEDVSEIKVIIDENHMLRTVAIVNGIQYFVNI